MAPHRDVASRSEPSLSVEDRLVATASELFYREGVRAVGIQRVIEEAGVAKASLYAHFDSKDDLVAACLDQRMSAGRAHVEARVLGSTLDARGKLLALFDLQGELIRNPEFRGCPLQSVSAEIADPDHPAKRVLVAHRQWLRDLFTALVTEAGLQPAAEVVGALIVLSDGASAAALVDGSAAMANHARWAAERLIDVGRQAPSRRHARHVARGSRRR
jgi:AcrR family transcriptional regulator